MTIHDIRLANLRALKGTKSVATFASSIDTAPDYLSQIFSAKTKANVGSRLARKIEVRLDLPTGWMDERHDEPLPINSETAKLLADYLALPVGLRQHIRRKTAQLRDYADSLPPFIQAALVPPADDHGKYNAWEREMEADMIARKANEQAIIGAESSADYRSPGTKRIRLRKGKQT